MIRVKINVTIFEKCFFGNTVEDVLERINDFVNEVTEDYECQTGIVKIEKLAGKYDD